jgi:hypothetical protein
MLFEVYFVFLYWFITTNNDLPLFDGGIAGSSSENKKFVSYYYDLTVNILMINIIDIKILLIFMIFFIFNIL